MRDEATFALNFATTDPKVLEQVTAAARAAGAELVDLGDAADDSGEQADKAGGRWKRLMETLEAENARKVIDGLKEMAAAVGDVARAANETRTEAAAEQRELERWGSAVGALADEMENLGRVGKLTGGQFADVGDVGDLIQELGDRAKEAAIGNEEYQKTFAALGVRVTDGAGKLRPAVDLFIETSDALGQMSNQSLAMAFAGDLMTDLGRKWISTVREQGGSLTNLLREMDRYGHLTDEDRDKLERYRRATFELEQANASLSRVWSAEAAPAAAAYRQRVAEVLTVIVRTHPHLAAFLSLMRDAAPSMIPFAAGLAAVAVGLRAMGVNLRMVWDLLKGSWRFLVGLGPVAWLAAAGVAGLAAAFAALKRDSDRALDNMQEYNERLADLEEQGYLSADAVAALSYEIDNMPSAFDRWKVSYYENFLQPLYFGLLKLQHPFTRMANLPKDEADAILGGPQWYRDAKAKEGNEAAAAGMAPSKYMNRRGTFRKGPPDPDVNGLRDGDGKSAADKQAEEAQRLLKQADQVAAEIEALKVQAEKDRATARAPRPPVPREGQRVLGMKQIGIGSTAEIHKGTHVGGGVFDITGDEVRSRYGGDFEKAAADLAAMGYIAAHRVPHYNAQGKVDNGIYSEHIHAADPYTAPDREVDRLRKQAASDPKVKLPPGSVLDPAAEARLKRIEELQAKEEALRTRAYQLTGDIAALKRMGTAAAQSVIDQLREQGELEIERARTVVAQLEADKASPEEVVSAREGVRERELEQAQRFGTPLDVERLRAQQIRERAQEAEEAAAREEEARHAAAQTAIDDQTTLLERERDKLELMREQGASLAALMRQSEAILDAETKLAELKRDDVLANRNPADDAKAQSDYSRAVETAGEGKSKRDRDLRTEWLGRRDRELQQAVQLAEAEEGLAEVEAGHEGARDRLIQQLVLLERHYLATGRAVEALETRQRRLRLEQDQSSTMAEQILGAGPGVGSVQAFLSTLGVQAVNALDDAAGTRGAVSIPADALKRPGLVDVPAVDLPAAAGDILQQNKAGIVAACRRGMDMAVKEALEVMTDAFGVGSGVAG